MEALRRGARSGDDVLKRIDTERWSDSGGSVACLMHVVAVRRIGTVC